MIKLYYRHKNDKGEWVTDSTSQSWNTADELFDATVKVGRTTMTMAQWLLAQHCYFYIEEEQPQETITCPF